MLPIRGVYEIAIRVRDLARAEAYYKEVLGLEEALRDESRNWLFMWVGGKAGMVVLQEDKGEWPAQHFAFTVDEKEFARASLLLQEKGIAVSEPVHHEWMNADSIYFADPDGHDLELIALRYSSTMIPQNQIRRDQFPSAMSERIQGDQRILANGVGRFMKMGDCKINEVYS